MSDLAIFRRPDGTHFEVDWPLAKLEKHRVVGTRYLIDGEEVIRDISAETALAGATPAQRRRLLPKYPIRSFSLGVAPQRAAELRARLQAKGCGTCVNERGQVIFESETHRRSVARALGFVHSESYYD